MDWRKGTYFLPTLENTATPNKEGALHCYGFNLHKNGPFSNLFLVFLNGPIPASVSFIFSLFKQTLQFFYNK